MKRPDTLANELEKLLGRASSDALIGASGVDDDPLLAGWVTRIGGEVTAHSDRLDSKPEFLILGSDVANALTLPGSKVLVTRGLLDEITSDDELAGVLAHESAHVAKRHAWQQIEGNALFALAMRLLKPKGALLQQGLPILNLLRALAQSRDNEYQADHVGLGFAAAAGYAPLGLLRFIETMASGPMARWEEYFATHPPGAKRAQAGRALALLQDTSPDSRATLAAGFAQRGFVGVAELARLGRDPLALPTLSAPQIPEGLRDQRLALERSQSALLKGLLKTYKPLVTASTLQQLLLLTAPSQDIRFLALATHAYLVQFRIQDTYARTVRSLRVAAPVWDDLATGSHGDPRECELGRAEVKEALRRLEGVPAPLQRASQAALTALADLQLGRFYHLSSGAQWTRIGAIEGLVRYAESELSRADKAAGIAWRFLSLARIRRYQRRLTALVPQDNTEARGVWQELAARRLGRPPDAAQSTGEASLRTALLVQLGKEIPRLGPALSVEGVAQSGGIPENIATVLRLLTLDVERELAARAYLRQKS
ncbi:M48 family metalloprotease [Armatimonas rosea]|uniref:Peptidase M48 domain-containing protein n=1 Tax=Armatimonas rosea TaxID=685828 RepID=A0A7W9WA53_ARMRO|nr:hypothetical protein [Armatimonas rosea]